MTTRVSAPTTVHVDVRALEAMAARAENAAAAPLRSFSLAMGQEELVPETMRRTASSADDLDSLVRAGYLRV